VLHEQPSCPQVARLTDQGLRARPEPGDLLAGLADRWRATVTAVCRPGTAPDGWRAAIRRPVTLPHYPMVLNRGGYPDGN
jgi:hypothetical protein